MANKRIKDISTTATSAASDDFVVIDGSANGTRKIDARPLGGVFDENVVVENGGNKTTYASNFLRSENGSYYIDAFTTGGDIVFRTSVASALDTQSMVIDGATGFVGIGKSPGAKLDVMEAGDSIKADFTNNVNANFRIKTSGANTQIGPSTASNLELQTGNTTRATIDTGGNVGIGGSPQSKLHVYSSTADNLRLERDATNDWRIQLTGGALAFRDATADAERVRIDSSGRVGVNNSSPGSLNAAADDLVVGDGSGHRGITVYAGTGSGSSVYFADGDSGADEYRGFISYDHATNALKLGSDGTTRTTIDSSGRLGVGTDSPSAGAVGGKVVHVQSTGETASVRVDRSDASTSGTLSLTAGNGTLGVYGTGSKPIAFSVNGSEVARLDDTGRLGVGTASPGSYDGNADDLVVATGGDTGITIRSSSTGGGNIYFADGTTGDQRYRGYVSYSHNTDTLSISSSGEVKLRAGASEAVRIVSSGNVGIGTASPDNKLTLDSGDIQLQASKATNVDVQSINWKNTNSSGYDIARISAATGGNIYEGQLKFLTKDSGGTMATRAVIDSSGRVSIGNDNAGIAYSEADDLVVGNNAVTTSGMTITTTGGGTGSLFFSDGSSGADTYRGQIRYLHGANQMMFAVDTNEAFRIGSGGDIVMASGNGIDFGSVAGGTGTPATDAGLLNDFERGSFTPSFTSTGTAPTLTYLAQVGTYTKVGNLVTCHGRVRVNAVTGAGTGSLRIAGLPFATQNVSNLGSGGAVCLAAFFGTSSSGCPTHISGGNNATVMTLKTLKNSAGVVASLDSTDAADLASSCYVDFSITYTTA